MPSPTCESDLNVFYEKNVYLVESDVNLTFDELQDLDDDQFTRG